LNISSIVVHTRPENFENVKKSLESSGLCEIHYSDEKGKIVVTIEQENTEDEIRTMKSIQDLPNVVSASFVYSAEAD